MPRSPLALFVLVVAGCASTAPEEAPVASGHASAGAVAATSAGGSALAFTTPAGWVAEAPTSSMRRAQYRLPRTADESEDGECVVYHFGPGGGGGIEANVERWCTQFEQPDGRASRDVLVESERSLGGRAVHEVELSGTYVAETAPGSGVRVNKPGFAMRGAIVASDHGAYYVKLVGPAGLVARQGDAFRMLLESAR